MSIFHQRSVLKTIPEPGPVPTPEQEIKFQKLVHSPNFIDGILAHMIVNGRSPIRMSGIPLRGGRTPTETREKKLKRFARNICAILSQQPRLFFVLDTGENSTPRDMFKFELTEWLNKLDGDLTIDQENSTVTNPIKDRSGKDRRRSPYKLIRNGCLSDVYKGKVFGIYLELGSSSVYNAWPYIKILETILKRIHQFVKDLNNGQRSMNIVCYVLKKTTTTDAIRQSLKDIPYVEIRTMVMLHNSAKKNVLRIPTQGGIPPKIARSRFRDHPFGEPEKLPLYLEILFLNQRISRVYFSGKISQRDRINRKTRVKFLSDKLNIVIEKRRK